MKKIFAIVLYFLCCQILFAGDQKISTNTIPYFVYGLDSEIRRIVGSNSFTPPVSGNIKQIDEQSIEKIIRQTKTAICGSNENVDAKVWMSFGANGEIGIGVKASASLQSGFEVTFHCGKLSNKKSS